MCKFLNQIMTEKSSRWCRLLLSLVPIVVGLIAFVWSKGMYQTMDDLDMRSLIEGSAGDGTLGGSPFCVYMNVVYGFILRFFYDLAPGVYWYDLFTYVLTGFAIVAITYLLQADSWRRNVMSVCVMSGIAAFYYTMPQFTMTAGVLAIACAYCIVSLSRSSKMMTCLVLSLMAVFFGLFSAMVRFQCFLVSCAFSGMLFVLCAKIQWRRFFTVSVAVGFVVLALSFGVEFLGRSIVSSNDVWRDQLMFNKARGRLVDRAGVWEAGNEKLPQLADKFTAKDGFDAVDYRCLLDACTLGRKELLDGERLKRVAEKLGPQISILRPRRLSLAIREEPRFFWLFSIFTLCVIVVFNRSVGWKVLCIPIAFIGINVIISTYIHYVPFRVWWNFVAACFIAALLLDPTNLKIPKFKKWPIVSLGFPIAALFALLLAVTPNIRYQRFKERTFAQQYARTELPAGYLYLMDFGTLDMLGGAFRPNPNENRPVIIMGLAWTSPYDNLLNKWNISQRTTLEDICSPESKVRLVCLNSNGQNHPLKRFCRSVSGYVAHRTGKRVAAYGTDLGNGVSLLQLRQLGPDERDATGIVVDDKFQVGDVLKIMAKNKN